MFQFLTIWDAQLIKYLIKYLTSKILFDIMVMWRK